MKEIEKVIKAIEQNVGSTGTIYTGFNLPVFLNNDYKLSINYKADDNYYFTEEQLQKMPEKERLWVEKFMTWRRNSNEEIVELYNEASSIYNDYCGKRAGEPFLLDLVMQGYNIGNVLSFNPAKVLAKSGSKKCQR